MATTTSFMPGHPFDDQNPFGGLVNITDAELNSLNAAFFEALNAALRAETGDESMFFIPQTGEIMYDCIGTGPDAMEPVTPWSDDPDGVDICWGDIWRNAGESVDVEGILS